MPEEVITRRCCTCKVEKTLEQFPRSRNQVKGRGYDCNECACYRTRIYYMNNKLKRLIYARERYIKKRDILLNQVKTYRKTPKAKALEKERARKNRYKLKANQEIRKAVRNNILIRPTVCEQCGNKKTRIEAHHHAGYDPAHWLDVKWLCKTCHRHSHRLLQ